MSQRTRVVHLFADVGCQSHFSLDKYLFVIAVQIFGYAGIGGALTSRILSRRSLFDKRQSCGCIFGDVISYKFSMFVSCMSGLSNGCTLLSVASRSAITKNKRPRTLAGVGVVRGTGIEPVHPFGYKILSLGRLPIPPPAPDQSVRMVAQGGGCRSWCT